MTRYDKILRRIQNHPIISIVLIIGILIAPFAYFMGIFQNVSSLFWKSKESQTIHQMVEKSPGSIQAGRDVNINITGAQSPNESTTLPQRIKPQPAPSKTNPRLRSQQNKGGEEYGEALPKKEPQVAEPYSSVDAPKQTKDNGENMKVKSKPKLWITYAWKDNAGGNFDFLIQELEKTGIDTSFDKVALVPGKRLWEQIAARIEDPSLDGWAILLTKQSLQSEASREELAYALGRALTTKGAGFPLIGLMDQIGSEEVPAPLRARLLIDLRDPRWPQLVLAGLKGVAPEKVLPAVSRYNWEFIPNFRGPHTIAIMVRPRLGELRNWRFIYPETAKPVDWGIGPPNKNGFTGIKEFTVEDARGTLTGQSNLRGEKIKYLGAGNSITPGNGCYIVFEEPFPKFIGFAVASEPFAPPIMGSFEFFTVP